MVDMKPIDPSIIGTVYDHHPDHPEERKYSLVWGDVPASLVVYREHQKLIPEEESWKVVVGLAGDGQPERTPAGIWQRFPELTLTVLSEYYNKTYHTPLFSILSSLINAPCRLNTPETSFHILMQARSPLDILNNSTLQEKRKTISKITKNARSEGVISVLPKNVVLLAFESMYGIQGRLASALASEYHTAIALNEYNGNFSVRGALANLIRQILEKYPEDFHVGGHEGFLGGKVLTDPKQLSKVLVKEL